MPGIRARTGALTQFVGRDARLQEGGTLPAMTPEAYQELLFGIKLQARAEEKERRIAAQGPKIVARMNTRLLRQVRPLTRSCQTCGNFSAPPVLCCEFVAAADPLVVGFGFGFGLPR
eukprot:SAG11_NODE_411_length_9696_cov_46.841513_7_plen_117_part_00